MKYAVLARSVVALLTLLAGPALTQTAHSDDFAPITPTVVKNESVFLWEDRGSRYARLRFTQEGRSVVVAGTVDEIQGRSGFRLKKLISRPLRDGRVGNDYTRFEEFHSNAPVTVEVFASPYKRSGFRFVGETQFLPIVHQFDPEVYGSRRFSEIRLDKELPGTARVGDVVEVSGRVLTSDGLRADAYVVAPASLPGKMPLRSPSIRDGVYGPRIGAGQPFRLAFRVERNGAYIVEINNYHGIAALNEPIYVGSGVPLLPNPLDYQAYPTPGAPVEVAQLQSRWIELINRDRAAYGLPPVSLDRRLSQAAQHHIDDMTRRNYFSHAGMDGSSPMLRAQRAGVSPDTLVGENIGQGMRIEDLQAQLMASAVHRANLLNPNWKKVGLGIGRYPSGLLVGAQELAATAGEYELHTEYFAGVALEGEVPTGIAAGEKVELRGRVTQRAKSVLVFFQNKRTGRYVTFQPQVKRDGRFSVKLKFDPREAGAYAMGISLNGSSSRAASVVVRA